MCSQQIGVSLQPPRVFIRMVIRSDECALETVVTFFNIFNSFSRSMVNRNPSFERYTFNGVRSDVLDDTVPGALYAGRHTLFEPALACQSRRYCRKR